MINNYCIKTKKARLAFAALVYVQEELKKDIIYVDEFISILEQKLIENNPAEQIKLNKKTLKDDIYTATKSFGFRLFDLTEYLTKKNVVKSKVVKIKRKKRKTEVKMTVKRV